MTISSCLQYRCHDILSNQLRFVFFSTGSRHGGSSQNRSRDSSGQRPGKQVPFRRHVLFSGHPVFYCRRSRRLLLRAAGPDITGGKGRYRTAPDNPLRTHLPAIPPPAALDLHGSSCAPLPPTDDSNPLQPVSRSANREVRSAGCAITDQSVTPIRSVSGWPLRH